MPNKTYWNQVQEIMEFTDAMGGLLGKKAYGERDRQETQEILRDVKERKARANDKPMEMITLACQGVQRRGERNPRQLPQCGKRRSKRGDFE